MPTTNPTSPPPNQYPALLDKLISGSIGPLANLQEAVNLTLDQVSSWIAQPRTRQQIENLNTLLNAQTQLMMCQHRLIAVAKLAEVASTASAPETIRRACVDLLKYNVLANPSDASAAGRGGPSPMQPPDDITRDMILEALGEMGEKDRQSYEDQDPRRDDRAPDLDPSPQQHPATANGEHTPPPPSAPDDHVKPSAAPRQNGAHRHSSSNSAPCDHASRPASLFSQKRYRRPGCSNQRCDARGRCRSQSHARTSTRRRRRHHSRRANDAARAAAGLRLRGARESNVLRTCSAITSLPRGHRSTAQ